MGYSVQIKEQAQQDLLQGAVYYEEQQNNLGKRFLQEIEKSIKIIQETPLHYPIKNRFYRELYMRKFPYIIIYELIELQKEIIIYRIFNTYQNPDKKPK